MAEAKRLILVPTQCELQHVPGDFASKHDRIELCGFGIVAAGARTAQLLTQFAPSEVLLIGIAGALNSEARIGKAYSYGRVVCYGVGVGSGPRFRTVEQMGWVHCNRPHIGDQLDLERSSSGPLLLSATAASDGPEDVRDRLTCFPEATAEDMEGFAVAVACKLANVPLRIIRGISNAAGHRDVRNWQIPSAMRSAISLAREILNP